MYTIQAVTLLVRGFIKGENLKKQDKRRENMKNRQDDFIVTVKN